jgi:dihydrodipicolinate synthase/N-acetylneuraminate lyase
VIARLRESAPNLRGLKVSDSPWEAFEPYLLDGLDLFVGSEPLLVRALLAGAAGAVSALASCFPDRVAAVAADPTPAGAAELERLRAALEQAPFQAGCKLVASRRGVPIGPDVRAPLRRLNAAELAAFTLP